jgi:hypothetical protein
MRNVAVRFDGAEIVGAAAARIGAQVLAAPMRRSLAPGHHGTEHLVESLVVIDVGPGHDERHPLSAHAVGERAMGT